MHEKACQFRRSMTLPFGLECEHGYDVCPICDPCTCKMKTPQKAFEHRAEVLEHVAIQQAQLAPFAYELLEAVKLAYRKHHLDDQTVGWEELSDTLHNALCNAMGDDGYQRWLEEQNNPPVGA